VENPRKYYRNNVAGSLSFLDALVEHGLDKIVFSSTCAVYGDPADTLVRESDPLQPLSPYGDSKLFIERALRWLDSAHRLRSVCLRYFNAAGADSDGEIGEAHDPETHIIPLVIQVALGQREAISVFGIDYPTADGSAVRDFIHVADLARAHVLALGHLFDGGNSVAVNLGTGLGHSVLDVIGMVKKVSGRPVPVKFLPRRAGDPASLAASAKMAESLLGWVPEYSLENIVQHAWHWHAHQRDFAQAHRSRSRTVGARTLY
jgi:UDP-arabinose 4-epimerase